MNCYWDRNKAAIGICKFCGRAICETCIGNDSPVLICNQCYNNEILAKDNSYMICGLEEPYLFSIVQYQTDESEETTHIMDEAGEDTCLVCHESLEIPGTPYCKSCQELIKYGL